MFSRKKTGFTLFLIWGIINISFAQKIIRAEYFIDADPGRGNGIPISINSQSDSIDLNVFIPTTGLASGSHQLFFSFQDSLLNWSIIQGKTFIIKDAMITFI